MKAYVVGFMFSPSFSDVLLIRKNKQAWQAGLLNGVGGSIEEGEAMGRAMIREFREEVGIRTRIIDWFHYCTMSGDNNDDGGGFRVEFFACVGPIYTAQDMSDVTGEKFEIINLHDIHPNQVGLVENVPWLIGLAIDHLKDGRPKFSIVEYP